MIKDPPAAPVEPSTTGPLVTAAITAGLVYTLDAWVIGQGGIATFTGLIAIGVALVRMGAAGVKRRWLGIPVHAGVAIVWATTITLTWASISYQAVRAKARAEIVVAACKSYKATNGDYPEHLEQLVPQYLPSIPRAKYTLGMGDFTYMKRTYEGTPHTSLMFVTIAPFMRTSYIFEDDRWVTID